MSVANEERRCAIIGAGGSGIAAARWALAYGIKPVVFERTDGFGGIWRYDPRQKNYASVMRSTTANTSKEMTAFSDFPPHESHNIYMHNTELLKYFEEYVEHHNLRQHMLFRHTVTNVKRASDYSSTGRWVVEYEDEDGNSRMETFDAVLSCYGNVTPNRNGIERAGQAQFSGRILHACEVKNADEFHGTVNVVVGFAASASDIAVELARVSKKTYLSTRSGGRVIVRADPHGQPLDMAFLRRFDRYILPRILPARWREQNLIRRFQAHIDHEKCGLATKDDRLFSKNIVMNNDLPSQILTGAVSIRPDIASYTAEGVIFANGGGSVEKVDNVIFATGYIFEAHLIEGGALIPLYENYAFLYKHIFPPQTADHNTLGFIGIQNLFGSLLPTVEMQCRVFFDQLAGDLRLPSQSEMTQIVDGQRESAYKRAAGRPLRAALSKDGMNYLEELSELIGCRPSVWRTALKGDLTLAHALLFGPNASYAYRLEGPQAWDGARDALLNINQRVDFPLRKQQLQTPAIKKETMLEQVQSSKRNLKTPLEVLSLILYYAMTLIFIAKFNAKSNQSAVDNTVLGSGALANSDAGLSYYVNRLKLVSSGKFLNLTVFLCSILLCFYSIFTVAL